MQNGRENQSGGHPRFSPGSRSAAVQGDSGLTDKISVLLLEEGQSGFPDLAERPEWKLAVRVASSKSFSRSELLPRFLLYVCELALTGRTEEITEQRIGTRVFLRPEGYNPGEDNIVRNYARQLRKRLNEYFEIEGRAEAVRIAIPRGGYVPVFEENREENREGSAEENREEGSPGSVAELPELSPLEAVAAGQSKKWQSTQWFLLLVVFLGGAAVSSIGWLLAGYHLGSRELSPANALWTQIFQRSKNTILVPADSGLGILQNLTRSSSTLENYADGSFLEGLSAPSGLNEKNLNDLRRQRYTSFVCLTIATALAQLPEFISNRTEIRFGRFVSTEDLKRSNVILLGSVHTNPWVGLFDKQLNFRPQYTDEVDNSSILNVQPRPGEQKVYRNDPTRTYALVDYLPNLSGTGHVLILQGLSMAGTQAAADVLFNASEIRPVLEKATLRNGTLKPFELLIETDNVGATSPGARIVASRF
jgi:hypothetical protein